jgi:plasmid stabilization system protein ParE
MRLTLTERALKDIEEARAWYNNIGRDLGDALHRDITQTVDTVLERPRAFPEQKPGIRGARCERFPYKVYYRIRSDDEVRVLAVYHLKRDPNRWDDSTR